jgi:hypothetical protein
MGAPRVLNVAVGPHDLVEGNRRRRGLKSAIPTTGCRFRASGAF